MLGRIYGYDCSRSSHSVSRCRLICWMGLEALAVSLTPSSLASIFRGATRSADAVPPLSGSSATIGSV
jgi:hypothetical protein